jgi:hypothetical protein
MQTSAIALSLRYACAFVQVLPEDRHCKSRPQHYKYVDGNEFHTCHLEPSCVSRSWHACSVDAFQISAELFQSEFHILHHSALLRPLPDNVAGFGRQALQLRVGKLRNPRDG